MAKLTGWHGKKFYTNIGLTKIPILEYTVKKQGNRFVIKFYRIFTKRDLFFKRFARNKTEANFIISNEKRALTHQVMLERSLP